MAESDVCCEVNCWILGGSEELGLGKADDNVDDNVDDMVDDKFDCKFDDKFDDKADGSVESMECVGSRTWGGRIGIPGLLRLLSGLGLFRGDVGDGDFERKGCKVDPSGVAEYA